MEEVEEVHRVSETVGLEERARDRAKGELLQQRREQPRALGRRRVAELLGGERLAEELEEVGQRVLVHRVEPAQVEEREEEKRAGLRDRPEDVALAIERELELRRLA